MVMIGNYDYYLSDSKNHKLKVNVDGKWIHFGHKDYEHYFDKTGLLDKKLNHKDIIRRESYLKRAKGIKDKNNKLTWNDPKSANFHAVRILW